MTLRNGTFIVDRWRFSMDPFLPVIIIIITWVLSERYYPDFLYLGETYLYWLLGGATALFITFSIIIHEIGHSLAARFFNIPIQRIHLYLFGGMAELKFRPQNPQQELWIAFSGPVASLFLAGISWFINRLFFSPDYLAWYFLNFATLINILIAIFNLIPIFPLDGGRLLRALLWKRTNTFRRASKLTKHTGSIFILILIILFLTDMVIVKSGYALIYGILALYMFYTFFSGRKELAYSPTSKDLIITIKVKDSLPLFLQEIEREKPQMLINCILPMLSTESVTHVFNSKKFTPNRDTEISNLGNRPLEIGDFIDLDDVTTFEPEVTYNADWVPVLRNRVYCGMCDAREMRFWLQQETIKDS